MSHEVSLLLEALAQALLTAGLDSTAAMLARG